MGTHPNIALAETVYSAFQKGDMETFVQHIADDVVWHLGGSNLLTGTYTGKQEVMGFLGKMMELSGGTMQIAEIHDMLANDDHVVAMVRTTAERDGKVLDSQIIHVSHVVDGKFTELIVTPRDQAATDAFWS